MSIWQVLEIDDSSDVRAIKKAYARKLKVVRPDENPKEFQELHFAYKQAVYEAKHRPEQDSIELESSEEQSGLDYRIDYSEQESDLFADDSQQTLYEENSNQEIENRSFDSNIFDNDNFENEVFDSEQLEFESEEKQNHFNAIEESQFSQEDLLANAEEKRIISWVEILIKEDSKRHQFDLWQKIAETQFILVPEFNWRLGVKIFEMIAQHNAINKSKKQRYNRIEPKVLRYLDEVFNWNNNEANLRYELGDKLCSVIFIKLPTTSNRTDEARAIAGLMGGGAVERVAIRRQTPIEYFYYGTNLKRFVSFLIDLAICWICGYLILLLFMGYFDNVSIKVKNQFMFYVGAIFYVLGSYFFECSKFQATPGKMVFGLKVTDKRNSRISYLQGIGRAVSFGILSIGNYITLLINSWLGPRYLHDRISQTQVLDIRLSRAEHDKKESWKQ